MSPALSTFLFEAANFLVLAGALAWLFFKPVRAAIESRRAALQKETEDAAAKLAEADRLRSELKQRFADQDQELESRRIESIAAAEQQAKQVVSTAREAADREVASAKQRISHLEQSQLDYLARAIAETTGATVARLLTQLGQPDLDQALTAAACRELQAFEGNSLAPVRVESARPLNETDRKAILGVLGPAGESAEFRVIEELGIGLKIATSHGLVDVTAAGLASFSERLLASKLHIHDETVDDDAAVGGSANG